MSVGRVNGYEGRTTSDVHFDHSDQISNPVDMDCRPLGSLVGLTILAGLMASKKEEKSALESS